MTSVIVPISWCALCFVCYWLGYFIGRGTEIRKLEKTKP